MLLLRHGQSPRRPKRGCRKHHNLFHMLCTTVLPLRLDHALENLNYVLGAAQLHRNEPRLVSSSSLLHCQPVLTLDHVRQSILSTFAGAASSKREPHHSRVIPSACADEAAAVFVGHGYGQQLLSEPRATQLERLGLAIERGGINTRTFHMNQRNTYVNEKKYGAARRGAADAVGVPRASAPPTPHAESLRGCFFFCVCVQQLFDTPLYSSSCPTLSSQRRNNAGLP